MPQPRNSTMLLSHTEMCANGFRRSWVNPASTMIGDSHLEVRPNILLAQQL